MPDTQDFAASIIAESITLKVRGNTLGALGESLPKFDATVLSKELQSRLKKPFRLALLGTNNKPIKSGGTIEVTYSISEANRWRNDSHAKNGKKLFVIAMGMVAKLPSLRDVLLPITDEDLRTVIYNRALSWLADPKHRAFWRYLYLNPDTFNLNTLLGYAAECEGVVARSSKHDLPEFEWQHAWKLGLIPHVKLLEYPGEKNIEKFARPNLEMVGRLRTLSARDRKTISRVIEDDGSPDTLRATAKGMLEFSRTRKREKLHSLDYEQVVAVLSSRKAAPPTTPLPVAPKEKMLGDEAAVEDLLKNNGETLKALSDKFNLDNEEDEDEVTIGGRKVVKKSRVGTSVLSSAINRLITDKRFGGIIYVETAMDYLDCLKQLEGGEPTRVTEFLPMAPVDKDKNAIQNILDRAVNLYSSSLDKDVLTLWKKYLEARENVLQYKHELADHPLLIMTSDPDVLNACDALVKSYGEMMDAVAYLQDVIRHKHHDTSKRLMSRALALDVIFLRCMNNAVAIAGPTHPFHLWRWVQIAKLLIENRDDFRDIGEDIILKHAVNPPVSSPHLLLNSFVEEMPKDYVFIGIGSIGALPLYGDPESRTAAKFRAEEIGTVAQRFVSMAPYSKYGLEVVVVDPPSIADIIESLANVNKGRSRSDLIPVHVRVFRTREAPSSTDEEDSDIEELGAIIRETKGSIEIEPATVSLDHVHECLKKRTAHYTLIFEPGDATSFKIGIDISPTLSPLIIPRHYTYDQLEDQFDVIIQGDVTPFGSYYALFCDLLSIPKGNTIGKRSGASRWIPAIAQIGTHTMWFSVVDQGIEPTFKIPEAIRLDKRGMSGGGREIHTFTSRPDTIMRYVENVVKTGGLIPDLPTTERSFRLMQRLGGNTIPIVVSSASGNGQVVELQARGLLGVLAVTSWYEKEAPEALLISLDSEESRRWILGANEEDGRRGDLVALRQTTSGLVLEVLEVKTRDGGKDVYKTSGGEKNGRVISGHAVSQIDSTITILKRILAKTGISGVDRARREVLRDQMYMAVANRTMDPVQRERAVQMLDQFFDNEADKINGRLFVVHLESNHPRAFPTTPTAKGKSPGGNPVEVFEITESEAEDIKIGITTEVSTGTSSAPPSAPQDLTPPLGSLVSTPAVTSVGPVSSKPDTPAPSAPVATTPDNFTVLIGKTPADKDVYWITAENPNFGFLVTGDPGSGKTQLIRAIMDELRKCGFPVLVFDFKNDYADPAFNHALRLQVYDVVQSGLPFNPLSLIPNENGLVHPIRQCHEFANIVARVEGLKEQQTHRLVEAQRKSYEDHGLDPNERIPIQKVSTEPLFEEVLENLRQNEENVSDTVVYRLQKFSDLGLFPKKAANVSFEDLIQDGIVLTLNDAANDKLMQILAEIMIVKLHAIIKRGQQPRVLRRMLVFDEAWRVAKSQKLVELAREGRAFGVGMLIGTQNPRDLPETLISCLRTQLYLFNKDPENQKVIVRALCNATTGPHAQQTLKAIAHLGTFQGYFMNEQYKEGIRVNVIPHKDRT